VDFFMSKAIVLKLLSQELKYIHTLSK